MKRIVKIRAAVILLLLAISVPMLPSVFAEDESARDTTTILACSDFQAEAGNAAGQAQVREILAAMEADGITSADAFFCCGDYDYEYEDTKGGIAALEAAVDPFVSGDMLFLQGNHDSAVNTNGLTYSGDHDPENGAYGVFLINEDDYMHYNERELMIQRTAQLLTEYLNEKIAEGFDRPIFILSHLPLHYNMRTLNDGDNKHGKYIVDVLNEAGAKGLNLFFLFGHDHSNGWDDYLGGSSIYLAKGDEMLVSSTKSPNFVPVTINFTYMNAGYTGYYSLVNSGAETSLTMTYITISGNDVSIVRYDKNGLHDLKSAGVSNAYKNEGYYKPNQTVYPSPQVITLTTPNDKTPIADLLPDDTTQKIYRRVNAVSELKDGGRYLIVYNSSTDRILLPEVVMKADAGGIERIGFQIELSNAFGGDIVYGDFADREWSFTRSGNSWLLGADGKYAAFARTALYSVTATLTDEGTPFTISGDRDAFVFKSLTYYFNYNTRMLFNGYASDPAHFYLYEAIGYGVTVWGGEAISESGEALSVATVGEAVTLKADVPEAGKAFDRWTVEAGELTLADPANETLTFTMPASGVTLCALYRDAAEETIPDTSDDETHSDTAPDTPGDKTDPVSDGKWVIVSAVAAVVGIIVGGILCFLVLHKRKK